MAVRGKTNINVWKKPYESDIIPKRRSNPTAIIIENSYHLNNH